jgi:hypothetical protein
VADCPHLRTRHWPVKGGRFIGRGERVARSCVDCDEILEIKPKKLNEDFLARWLAMTEDERHAWATEHRVLAPGTPT